MSRSDDWIQGILDGLSPDDEPRVEFIDGCPPLGVSHLGVLDSSYNPPTLAHLRMLELATERLSLDAQLLLLAKQNVDKQLFGAPLLDRVRMMEALQPRTAGASIGAIAHARFIDKAKALRQALGAEVAIYFILGFDTVVRLFAPQYYEDMASDLHELFSLAEVIYANRTGYGPEEMASFLQSSEVEPFAQHLHFIEMEDHYAAMSSTEARRRAELGLASAEEMIPDEVMRFIEENGTYGVGGRPGAGGAL